MINTSWAFQENADALAKENLEIHKQLAPKAKQVWKNFYTQKYDITQDDMKNYMCYTSQGYGYGNVTYKVLSNPFNFTDDEQALICDNGNLCFGYRKLGNLITIYTD